MIQVWVDKHPDLKHYYFGNLTENRVTLTTGRDIDLVEVDAVRNPYFLENIETTRTLIYGT